jgi:sulfate adenylyltransferase
MKREIIVNSPYGDPLVDLLVPPEAIPELRQYANSLPTIQLSNRSVYDLELLANGAFSPLRGFMRRADYERVIAEMRLADGTLFPIPITLPISPDQQLTLDTDVALRDRRNNLLAIMRVDDIYRWDKATEAQAVYGTTTERHPLVGEMLRWGKINIAGDLRVLQRPVYYDFKSLRYTPRQARTRLARMPHDNVVAFATRSLVHRVHEEMMRRAMDDLSAALLLHPVVGMTRIGDIDHYTRVRAIKTLFDYYYDPQRALLSLLPLAMRLAGPREALWHTIIHRNFGATHMIIGPDYASIDDGEDGFYAPYAAQELAQTYAAEVGVAVVPFREMVYLPHSDRFDERAHVPQAADPIEVSGTLARRDYLNKGAQLPAWYARPEVAELLLESYPLRHQQGMCVWFTGLSGAGKSTIAEILAVLLPQYGRQATLLDGDIVRTHLSKGLGFSKGDRDTNVRRIGFVAGEIVRHGGLVLCAAISPYRATRRDVRNMIGNNYIEVYVDTPLDVCEARDTKGLYARARRGEIKYFTGIDDPYEPPLSPEIRLNTVDDTPEDCAYQIIQYMLDAGYISE